jgi:hypothetical protein
MTCSAYLINQVAEIRSLLGLVMGEFIVTGIIVVAGGVNWLYSRFREKDRNSSKAVPRKTLRRQTPILGRRTVSGGV